jgi:hypothetical protein
MNNSASSDSSILNRIESARKNYYDEKPKNLLFKKQQKFDCAESVTSNLDLAAVLPFVFRVEGNTIFFNYTVFKAIASPSIYMDIANYLFDATKQIIETHSKYNLNVDLTGLTMSAVERYRGFVVLVSNEGMKNGHGLLKYLDLIHVHNPPTFVEYLCSIVIPIVDPSIKDRFIIYFKNGSVVKYVAK